MSGPRVQDGWIMVPYEGSDLAVVEIGLQRHGSDPEWRTAFLDYVGGQRVAKVRPPSPLGRDQVKVMLRVSGFDRDLGRHVLGG